MRASRSFPPWPWRRIIPVITRVTTFPSSSAPSGASYGGEIRLGQQRFPLQCSKPTIWRESFPPAANYSFTANVQGNSLTLVSGGTTYNLQRVAPVAINPLVAIQQAGPAARRARRLFPPPRLIHALANYTVVHSTDFGKSLARQFPPATTVRTARYAFPDLARYFGTRPVIGGAYEDSKDHQSTGVSFTAQWNGQPVKGFVSAKANEQGAAVLVIFCRTDGRRRNGAS